MKVVIVGGVAGGVTAAARLRRLDEQAEIVFWTYARAREHIKTRGSRVYNKKMTAILLGEDTSMGL